MRIVSVFAAMDFVLLGILVGIRAVGSSADEVGQVIEPATANGKGPGTLVKGEPAEADIIFKRPSRSRKS